MRGKMTNGWQRTLATAVLTLFAAIVPTSMSVGSVTLYSHNSPWLFSLDLSTAAMDIIGSSSQNDSIEDLTSRRSDPDILYGVENQQGGTISRLVTINRHTGQQLDGPGFDEAILGFSEPFSTGIAISPADPSIAVVTGFDSAFNVSPTASQQFLWKVNVSTGQVLGAGIPIPDIGALAFNTDGSLLFSVDDSGRLITVDPDLGSISLVGDPGLSDFIEGLAFHPFDGRLFAIDGFTADNLVLLDPLSGSLISTIGRIRFAGAHGLAFNFPEPSSVTLAVLASVFVFPRWLREKRSRT